MEYKDVFLHGMVSPETIDVMGYTREKSKPLKSINGLKVKNLT